MITDRRSQIADRNKVCDHVETYLCEGSISCDQLRLCDHMETKVLRSAIETHPIIFRVLFHDSTLVCSIVGTVYVMNVFIIAAAKILTTRTKRPAIGTKSGRRFIYRPRKRRPNFSNIRTAYGRYRIQNRCFRRFWSWRRPA